MPPKSNFKKRRLADESVIPPSKSQEKSGSPSKEKPNEAITITLNPSITDTYKLDVKLNDMLTLGRKARETKLDFTKKSIDLDKTIISANELPRVRYGKNPKLFLLLNTDIQKAIEEFFDEKVFFENIEPTYWITGPSGIGKSFGLGNTILKERQDPKNKREFLYIILSDRYFKRFDECLFQDLIYTVSPYLKLNDFPKCPFYDSNGSQTPLMDWLTHLFKTLDFMEESLVSWKRFMGHLKQFFKNNGKTFTVVIDQTTVYYKLVKEPIISKTLKFFNEILKAKYSEKVILSSSNNNEALSIPLLNSSMQEQIFRSTDKTYFSNEQAQIFIQKYCNLNLTNAQIEKLREINCLIPLELLEFCKNSSNSLDFEEILQRYLVARVKIIHIEVHDFYLQKKTQIEWEKFILIDYFPRLETEQELNSLKHDNYIDRKYMYVKDEKLYSIHPLAKEVLDKYYSDRLVEFETINKKDPAQLYFEVYNSCGQTNPSLKGILLEKLVILQLLAKKETEIKITFFQKNEESLDLQFSKVIYFWNQFNIDLTAVKKTLYIPLKFNYPFTDFMILDPKEKTLHAFQVTLAIGNHKKSDKKFKESKNYENFSKNHQLKIIFVWITPRILENEIQKITNSIEADSLIIETSKNQDVWKGI